MSTSVFIEILLVTLICCCVQVSADTDSISNDRKLILLQNPKVVPLLNEVNSLTNAGKLEEALSVCQSH